MPKVNHRRKKGKRSYGKKIKVETVYPYDPNMGYVGNWKINKEAGTATTSHVESEIPTNNGYVREHSDQLDKSMQSWGGLEPLSGRIIGAGIGNDFSNGRRGMAKAVRGAKKYVRSRSRFHANAATKRMLRDLED